MSHRLPFPFPSDERIAQAIQAIHDRPERLAMAVTGGFAGLQQLLWSVPGSSRTLVEVVMTYHQASTAKYIGHVPEKFVSHATAYEMAKAAYERGHAHLLASNEAWPMLGLGGTATLSTDRPKKGACRYEIVVYGGENLRPTAFGRSNGLERLTRAEQGRLSDLDALNLVLEALRLEKLELVDPAVWPMQGWRPWEVVWPDGQRTSVDALDPNRHVFYPGSFNPLHEGHVKSAATVLAKVGLQPVFMIESSHPDKGPLSDGEIAARLAQFAWKAPVVVTRDLGFYIEKAKRFPHFGFVVGNDTMSRICDPRYYAPTPGAPHALTLRQTLQEFLDLDARFFVFDRVDGDRLRTLGDIPDDRLPAHVRERLCRRLEGRWDVSSSALRAQAART